MPGLPFGESRETKKFLMLKKLKPEILRYAKVLKWKDLLIKLFQYFKSYNAQKKIGRFK